MKYIMKIKHSPKDPVKCVAHTYRQQGRSVAEVPSKDRVAVISGRVKGRLLRKAAVDAKTLVARHHGGRSAKVKHVVISSEDIKEPEKRKEAMRAVTKIADDFLKRFAPKSDAILCVHRDRLHVHGHLVICNSDGKRALNWRKNDLREMQGFGWVNPKTKEQFNIESGRGKGRNPPEFSNAPYPLARGLLAKELAGLERRELYARIESGKEIQVARRNKRGEVTSVTYRGRTIRLATIEGLRGRRLDLLGGVVPQEGSDSRIHPPAIGAGLRSTDNDHRERRSAYVRRGHPRIRRRLRVQTPDL